MRSKLRLSLCFFLVLSGCNRENVAIREQQVPKQSFTPVMAMQLPPAPESEGELTWTVPKDWKELPGQQMRLASFQVSPQNPDLQMTIVPLAGTSGGLLANINRWEGQIGLPPSSEANLPKLLSHLDVNGLAIDEVDLMGPETAKPRMRMLGAILVRPSKTYYFKLSGPADVIGPQKANFEAFLKSIKLGAPGVAPAGAKPDGQLPADMQMPAGHPAMPGNGAAQLPAGHPAMPADGAAPAGNNDFGFSYTAPNGWTKDEPLPLRVVSFHVGDGDKRANVIVSKLPANGSGTYIDNINRWRGQVGLPPSKEGDQQPVKPMIVAGADGMVFDYIGPGDVSKANRMLLAWVPKGEDWWFIKLVGPSETVAGQEGAFGEFLKSVKFDAKN